MQLNGSTLRKAAVVLNLVLLCWFNCTTVVIGGGNSSKLATNPIARDSVAAKAEHEHADPTKNRSVLQRTQLVPNQSLKRERVLQSNTLVVSRDSSIKSTPVSCSVLRRKSSSQEPQPSSAMYSKKSIQEFFGGLVLTADEQHKEVQLYYLAGIVYFMYLETVACASLAIDASLAKQPDLDLMMHESYQVAQHAFYVAQQNTGPSEEKVKTALNRMYTFMETAVTWASKAEKLVWHHLYHTSTKGALEVQPAKIDEKRFEMEMASLLPDQSGWNDESEEAFIYGEYTAFTAVVKRTNARTQFASYVINKVKYGLYKTSGDVIPVILIVQPIEKTFAKCPVRYSNKIRYYYAGIAYGILEIAKFVYAYCNYEFEYAYSADMLDAKRETASQQKQTARAAVAAVMEYTQDNITDTTDQAMLKKIKTQIAIAAEAELIMEKIAICLYSNAPFMGYYRDQLMEVVNTKIEPKLRGTNKDKALNLGRLAFLQALIKRISNVVSNTKLAYDWAKHATSIAKLPITTNELHTILL